MNQQQQFEWIEGKLNDIWKEIQHNNEILAEHKVRVCHLESMVYGAFSAIGVSIISLVIMGIKIWS